MSYEIWTLMGVLVTFWMVWLVAGYFGMKKEGDDENGVHRGSAEEIHGGASQAASHATGMGAIATPGPATLNAFAQQAQQAFLAQQNAVQGLSGFGAGGTMGWVGSAGATSGNGTTFWQNPQAPGTGVATTGHTNHLYAGYAGGSGGGGVYPPVDIVITPKHEGIKLGEIIAYRCWPIKDGFLWSSAAGRAWAPHEPMCALKGHLEHGLGVFAFKEMSRVIEDYKNIVGLHPVAFGSIELWGEIVEHEIGYRAEYAIIRSIDFVRCAGDMQESYTVLRSLHLTYGRDFAE